MPGKTEKLAAAKAVRKPRQNGSKPKYTRPSSAGDTMADKMLHKQGIRGTDVRSPVGVVESAKTEALTAPGSTSVLPVSCYFYDRAVSYLAMGIVLKAMQKGYKWSDSSFGDCPYYAFRYIIDCVKSAMKGAIPQIQQAPLWFWSLLYAVKQKTVSFKTAQIKYSWVEIISGQGDDVAFSLGTGLDAYTLFWGVSSGSSFTINEIPVLGAPPPYLDQGPNAFNRMLSFFSGEGAGKLCGDPGSSLFDRDSSAFAAVFPEIGESYFSPGAMKVSVQSERQIDSPVLSKFAQYQQGIYRGWQQEKVSAGSSSYLGGRCSEFLRLGHWRNKTPPIFKFFNFDEFYYQLSKTLALAFENANPNIIPDIIPCPLTPQQVQLILRQNLLPYFNNELGQDLRYQGPDWVDMLPFTVGPNGVNYGRQAMYIPTFLAENIRCCRRITHELKSARGKSDRQVLDIIPILGRSGERSPLGNFTYGTGGATIYTVPPSAPLPPEVPVNLIDLSAVESSTTYYLDLNTEAYAAMVVAWNEWIQKYQAVLSSLVPLTGDKGACALSTLVYTNIQKTELPPPIPPVTTAVPGKMLDRRGSKEKLSVGISIPRKNKGVGAAPVPGSSYFNTVGEVRISGALGFNKELYPYISQWILPVMWSDFGSGIAANQATQVFQCEATFIERTSSNTSSINFSAPTAEDRMCSAAAVDVKTVTQDGDHALIQQLKELTKDGQGGFFTSIAAMIGDAVGVPQIRTIANAVSSATGL